MVHYGLASANSAPPHPLSLLHQEFLLYTHCAPICVPFPASRSRDYNTLPSAQAPLFYLCLNSVFTSQGFLPCSPWWDTPRETFLEHFPWVTVFILCLFKRRFHPALVCWRRWPLSFCLLLSPWCLHCRRNSINIYWTKQSVAAFLL